MKSKQHIFARSLLAAAVLGAYTHSFAADDTGAQNAGTAELETVNVVGSINKLPDVPFRQAKSAVAISAETLSEEGVEKMDEVGRYQAGFTNQPYGSDTNTNWFSIRGTEASQSFDGAPAASYGFFSPHIDPFGVESVEITKGADSITYGAANAGGLVNYISKRPHKNQVGKGVVEAHVGNNNQRGIAADYTGALNADQSLRYRLVGSYRKADGQWNGTGNESYYFAPSLSWDIGERTNLSLLANVQKDVGTPSSNFVPQAGSLFAVNGQKIDPDTNLGDPSVDNETNKQYALGYTFSHDFGNGLSFDSNYRYSRIDNKHTGVYVWPSLSGNFATRDVVINDGEATGHYADNRLTWQWKNQHIQNTLLAGIDYRKQDTEGVYQNMQYPGSIVSPNAVNVFAPTYGVSIDSSNVPRTDMSLRQTGFYLQDSVKLFNRIGITAGVRHDRARNEELLSGQSVKANHTSYSGSLMYYAPFGLNPYIAYSESFRLPTGLSGDQTLYDPNTTEQYEIGVKYLPSWLDGSISLAAYKARDKGALVSGAGGIGSTVSGDVSKRKGIELQAQGNLTDNISAQLAYTYQSRVDTVADVDYRNPLFAKHNASLRGSYHFNNGALSGLTLGAGIRYVGDSKVDGQWATYRGMKIPSSTVVDLFARYAINNNWETQLNVDNVGNRKYIAACDASYCYYGQGRSIVGKVSYKF
ncbi:TonB-dependent siderophore receptor [Neisseria dentiae]|uniref:TonB-dependent siderophore receptor n=1 Tax=Neisseria dentiae TaxID=194197 RepID=UPI00211CBE74|nr:TonB-dependent siderophore receptor [Neisseria dentiae]MCQ9327455.1 TonB-dependent siderophore receptor [Neisseria dentiae]